MTDKPVVVCLNKVDLVAAGSASPLASYQAYLDLPKYDDYLSNFIYGIYSRSNNTDFIYRVRAMVEECKEYIALENAPVVAISATSKNYTTFRTVSFYN